MLHFLFSSSISESFLTVKGAALFLPRGNSPTQNSAPRISQRRNKHTGKPSYLQRPHKQQLHHLPKLPLTPFFTPNLTNELWKNLRLKSTVCLQMDIPLQHHGSRLALISVKLFHNRADKLSSGELVCWIGKKTPKNILISHRQNGSTREMTLSIWCRLILWKCFCPGDLQKHLQTMFTVLRPEDTIRLVSNKHT